MYSLCVDAFKETPINHAQLRDKMQIQTGVNLNINFHKALGKLTILCMQLLIHVL